MEDDRILCAGRRVGLRGQFERHVAIAQRRLRTSGEEPCQIVFDPRIGWVDLQRIPVLGDRLFHVALLQKSVPKVVMGLRSARVDSQHLFEMGDGFVHSP